MATNFTVIMITSNTILLAITLALSAMLIIDTALQPHKFYTRWLRRQDIKRIRKQFGGYAGQWILITGSHHVGKSALLTTNQWTPKASMTVAGHPVNVWQLNDTPLWALEISFNTMGGINKAWWHALKHLAIKRVYYCLTIEECKQFKAKHQSSIETHIILSHGEQIPGFESFMADIDHELAFPIGQKQERYNASNLHDSFAALYAQLQTYANKIIHQTEHPEIKKSIGDFPQHCAMLQFGLNKVIAAMPVKQIYCYGQIWHSGSPKLVFSPPLGSGLHLIKAPHSHWQHGLLGTLIIALTFQMVNFQNRITETWEHLPYTTLSHAKTKVSELSTHNHLFGLIHWLATPSLKYSQQQADEQLAYLNEQLAEIGHLEPLLAKFKLDALIRSKQAPNTEMQAVLNEQLKPYLDELNFEFYHASPQAQFMAALHHLMGHHSTLMPLNLPSEKQIHQACRLLRNHIEPATCQKQAQAWLQPDYRQVNSIATLTQQLISQAVPADIKPAMDSLTTWLMDIQASANPDFQAFKFLATQRQKPDSNHPLYQLEQLSKTHPELKPLLKTTWQLLINHASVYMNSVWAKTIYPYYNKHFAEQYPVVANSPADASIDAFNQFYGANGLIQIFFNHYLRPFLDPKTNEFVELYPETTFPIHPETMSYIKTVASIQNIVFQGQPTPHIELNTTPIHHDDNWVFKSKTLSLPLNKPALISWPDALNQEGIEIVSGKKVVETYKGPWALWRWLESGQLEKDRVSFKNHAYKLSSETLGGLDWLSILRAKAPKTTLLN